jgi:hypothetical protein
LSALADHDLVLLPTLSGDLQNLTGAYWGSSSLSRHDDLASDASVLAGTGDHDLLPSSSGAARSDENLLAGSGSNSGRLQRNRLGRHSYK